MARTFTGLMLDGWRVWPAVSKMGRNRDNRVAQPPKSSTVLGSQSQADQLFEERLRAAENIVRALREAGFSCELSDGPARTLKPLD